MNRVHVADATSDGLTMPSRISELGRKRHRHTFQLKSSQEWS
jgi:hypothetical protein